jgi:hypothetical protein
MLKNGKSEAASLGQACFRSRSGIFQTLGRLERMEGVDLSQRLRDNNRFCGAE